jgi:hypothetical protein
VLAATLDGTRAPWPDAIVAHLAACDSCRELHVVATALQHDHADALARVRVPSAGQVWWRAELRARHEAAAAAARPITVATGLAVASLLGLLASLGGAIAWWLQDSLAMSAVLTGLVATWSSAASSAPTGLRLAVWFAAGAMLIATPVVLYLALRDE